MTAPGHTVLLVDDDEDLRQTFSAILQSQGYHTTTAASATEAIEKARRRFFDVALIDVNLPDMKGTQLLSYFQKISSGTIKIMITGYPSLNNAADALNIGADSYVIKPIDPNHLLKTIENKILERERITGKRLAEWVKLRLHKTQSTEFSEFLEKNASSLTLFKLSKTQAKIYIGLNALGVASASEIASLTNVRREEVYRTIPVLEKRGLATRKFGTPRRFRTIEPRLALRILLKTRINTMNEEACILRKKTEELIAQMEKTSFTLEEENSIETLVQQKTISMKLTQLIQKARNQIKLTSSFEQLNTMFLKDIRKALRTNANQISVQVIVVISETVEPRQDLNDVRTLKLLYLPPTREDKIEVRKAEVMPFNVLIVDSKEAIWGDFESQNTSRRILWTNDSTQISVLEMAFESLWRESQRIGS